ncbi:MAG: hypothetical protein DMG05_00180 [Acidobacteria bacterium]|nr:MAG: hypothetical protein DMG05_00180 [Acidobacteriota bacterium]
MTVRENLEEPTAPPGGVKKSASPPAPLPEGVKKFQTGRDREGEAPSEPHGARTCWGGGSPGGLPSQFFHTFPQRGRGESEPIVSSLAPIGGEDGQRPGEGAPITCPFFRNRSQTGFFHSISKADLVALSGLELGSLFVSTLVFSWLLLNAGCSRHDETEAKPIVTVRVARVELSDIRITVHAPASIFPREQANLAARITAPIRGLRVRKGSSVAAGQVLAILESRDIRAQRAEAAASVNDAQANLQKISAGTLPTEIERARGELITAEAGLNQAQKICDRRSQLFQQGAIPQRDLLVSQTELAQAKSAYEVAKKSFELLETQSRDKDIRIAESRLAQARARLELTEAQLQFTELRSPFSGSITEQFLYPGDMAKPEVPVFTIMDLSVAVARAQVPESEATAVRAGQRGIFVPTDSSQETFQGQVTVVNKAVDPSRRTVEVWCEIPNKTQHLRAGVFGTLSIVTGTAPKSLVVPVAAVQFKEGTHFGSVLLVDEKRIAHQREVDEIKKGLSAGEVVIVEGGYGLPEGTEVRLSQENPK